MEPAQGHTQAGSCVLSAMSATCWSQVLATLPKLGHPWVLFLAGREQQPQTNPELRASRQPPAHLSSSRHRRYHHRLIFLSDESPL